MGSAVLKAGLRPLGCLKACEGFTDFSLTVRYNKQAMNRSVIDRVERAISTALTGMAIVPGERILIALSGGADSVTLTHALNRISAGGSGRFGCTLAAAHLNHRLRGDEADRDERFVRELCERLRIELVVERAQNLTESLNRSNLPDAANLEERAREVRYAFLNRAADRVKARYIAVAHHQDDQAETVMLRLLRGSGVAGLGAMDTDGPGRIVRPLLGLGRAEILTYLEAIGATYVCDSSNNSPVYLRNRVRHELMPMLERDYSPRLGRRLAGLAREMRELGDYIAGEGRREVRQRLRNDGRLELAGFDWLHPALAGALIREWLRASRGDLRRVYRAEIERITRLCVAGAPGATLNLAGGWRLSREYGCAVIERVPATTATSSFATELAQEGVTEVEAAGFTFIARLRNRSDAGRNGEEIPRAGLMEALFDAGRIERLIVRGYRPGDRVQPLGMSGTRKVHDVFVDRKLPRAQRATWPIIESGSEILWIPGMVRSGVALVSEATDKVLRLNAKPCANLENSTLLRI